MVYKITKQLSGQRNSSIPVKEKQGKLITTEKDQAARWVQHLEEVLKCPEPDEPANSTSIALH